MFVLLANFSELLGLWPGTTHDGAKPDGATGPSPTKKASPNDEAFFPEMCSRDQPVPFLFAPGLVVYRPSLNKKSYMESQGMEPFTPLHLFVSGSYFS